MNDFVMMAIFVAVPILGGLGMYLVVRGEGAQDGHENDLPNSEIHRQPDES